MPTYESAGGTVKERIVFRAKATPERRSAFSDGVFAVLITVLVLELRPPELPTFKALRLLWPTWLSYAVSWLFIAIVWTNHHHLMRHATEATPRLMGPISRICFPYRCFRSPPLGWRRDVALWHLGDVVFGPNACFGPKGAIG